MTQPIKLPKSKHILATLTINTYDSIGILLPEEEVQKFKEILSKAELVYTQDFASPKIQLLKGTTFYYVEGEPYFQTFRFIELMGKDVDTENLLNTLKADYAAKAKAEILQEYPDAANYFKD